MTSGGLPALFEGRRSVFGLDDVVVLGLEAGPDDGTDEQRVVGDHHGCVAS